MKIVHTFELPDFFDHALKALLCLLLLTLLAAIAAALATTGLDLWRNLGNLFTTGRSHGGFKAVLIDALTVLVFVEVYRTALAYFIEGRVKVTYIIDTVLVAVLTEALSFWHRQIDLPRMGMLLALVLTLMAMRILAIRFSPRRRELTEGL